MVYRKQSLSLAIIISCILISSVPAIASTPAVLGENTSQFYMQPTAEGPGLIQPDNPFFFLDLLRQQSRLFLAFNSLSKAETYNAIANERFAQFRVEILRNNRNAAYIALQGLKDNTFNASQALAKARDDGENVTNVARRINQDIVRHQTALDELALQATGELKGQLIVAQGELSDAKSTVENGLSSDEAANAMQQDLARQAAEFSSTTVTGAIQLKATLDMLQKPATNAAGYNQIKSEVAVHPDSPQTNADLSRILQLQAASEVQQIVNKAQQIADTVKVSQIVARGNNTVLGISQMLTPTPLPVK